MVIVNVTRISKISESPPAAVENILKELGGNIRIARLRRKLSMQELANRIGISRYVMADVENGKPNTAIAAYMGALWVLNLHKDMRKIADPDSDEEGKILERARSPKTAPKRRSMDDDF